MGRDSFAKLARDTMACEACPRLRAWCRQVAREKRRAYRDHDYWGRPVPGFGDAKARLLIVGLAPGAHGSNRTGRPFTGDASGEWLYGALHRFGFASRPESIDRNDGLRLDDCFITAVGRCAPPGNKPTPDELGRPLPRPRPSFTHGRWYALDGHPVPVLATYYPSRQNTQTGRLTRRMWAGIFRKVRRRLDG